MAGPVSEVDHFSQVNDSLYWRPALLQLCSDMPAGTRLLGFDFATGMRICTASFESPLFLGLQSLPCATLKLFSDVSMMYREDNVIRLLLFRRGPTGSTLCCLMPPCAEKTAFCKFMVVVSQRDMNCASVHQDGDRWVLEFERDTSGLAEDASRFGLVQHSSSSFVLFVLEKQVSQPSSLILLKARAFVLLDQSFEGDNMSVITSYWKRVLGGADKDGAATSLALCNDEKRIETCIEFVSALVSKDTTNPTDLTVPKLHAAIFTLTRAIKIRNFDVDHFLRYAFLYKVECLYEFNDKTKLLEALDFLREVQRLQQ